MKQQQSISFAISKDIYTHGQITERRTDEIRSPSLLKNRTKPQSKRCLMSEPNSMDRRHLLQSGYPGQLLFYSERDFSRSELSNIEPATTIGCNKKNDGGCSPLYRETHFMQRLQSGIAKLPRIGGVASGLRPNRQRACCRTAIK